MGEVDSAVSYTFYEHIDSDMYCLPADRKDKKLTLLKHSNTEDINVIFSKAQCSGGWAVQIALNRTDLLCSVAA